MKLGVSGDTLVNFFNIADVFKNDECTLEKKDNAEIRLTTTASFKSTSPLVDGDNGHFYYVDTFGSPGLKKTEKTGKEWHADYLPEAFEEAKQLIEQAKERKGFK